MAGGAPLQPFQPMMLAPPRPPVGCMPPPGFPHPQAPYPQLPMGQQLAANGLRSGTITPKAAPGSGATTPLHPMQRTLSASQMLAAPLPLPAYPQQLGMPYMVAPPPGVVLPESLSPGSPGGLRPAAAAGSVAGSRVQSAAYAAHARAGLFGGPAGPMEPLQRSGLQRAGSAGSTSGSLRSSLELGSLGGASGAAPFQPSRAPSLAGSRVGSAARKGSTAPAPPPELDEFDNIKVGGESVTWCMSCMWHRHVAAGTADLHIESPPADRRWRCGCAHQMPRSWRGATRRPCLSTRTTSGRCVSLAAAACWVCSVVAPACSS